MTSFARVLVPLSLTESDHELLRYVAQLAKRGIGTDYLFAHAAPPGRPDLDSVQRKTELEALVAAHFASPAGTKSSVLVERGPRIDWLIRTAISFRADVTVLGHRTARSGTRSVAQRMSQLAPGSVWLVPQGSPATLRNILAPVDFSEHSAHSLSIATEVARTSGQDQCLALHVYFDPSTLQYYENIFAARANERSEWESFIKTVDVHGIAVEPRFEESSKVAATILRVAVEERTDLIVMSTRGRSRAVAILLGSVTSQVMATSPIPVLAVKQAGPPINLLQMIADYRSWSQPNPKTN